MNNVGGLAEDAAQEAVERALGADFVFRSPRKESDGKEVTDVLVLYDNLAIILQVKSMEKKPDGSWKDDDLGWARKHLSKALRQVNGAAKHLKANTSTRIENPRRGSVKYDRAAFPHMIGLVVLNHPPTSFRPERTSDEHANLNIPTHVISLNDLLNLADFLDTPEDIIAYLACRIELKYPKFDSDVHEEEQAFRFYVQHYEQIHAKRAEAYGDAIPEEKFRPAADFLRRYIADPTPYQPYGAVFDNIIESLHQHDRSIPKPRLPDGAVLEVRNDSYIEAATALARYPRIKRVALARRIFDLIKDAEAKRTSLSFQTFNPATRTSLVVLATQHDPRDPLGRQARTEELMPLAMLAKAANQAEIGVGIATEGRINQGRSYDLQVYAAKPQPDPLAEKLATETWGRSGHLGDWLP